MNKLIKIAIWTIGSLFAIVIAAIIIIPLVIDPNDYKGLITEQVKQATGRELTLEGDLDLSVFPWLGIKTGAVKLSQPKGFGDQPMFEIGEVQLQVKLLPLLGKNLEIDTIVIKDINANLIVNKSGVSNWQDLTAGSTSAATATESSNSSVPVLEIDGIKIAGGTLTLEDKQLGTKHILSDLVIKSGKVLGGQAPFHFGFNLSDGADQDSIHVSLDSNMGINLAEQTLVLDKLHLKVGPMELEGHVEGSTILDKPSFNGELNADDFNLRELLAKLGVEVDTSDDKAMTQVGFSSQFTATDNSIAFKDLSARLDDSELKGEVSVDGFSKSSYKFDLNVNEINVDRYLAAATGSLETASTASGKPGILFVLPLEVFKGLKADGNILIGKIKASGLIMTDIVIAVNSNKGKVSINPIDARLYGGTLSGNMVYSQSGSNARLVLKESMTNVDLGQLFVDAGVTDSLEGRGKLTLNANVSEQSGKRNQHATVRIDVRDGAVKGLDIGKIIRQARSIRDKVSGKQSNGESSQSERTEFSELFGTFKLDNHLVQNTDLTLKAPLFRVGGHGTADLARQILDYKLTVKVVGTSKGQDGASQDKLAGVTIPVKLYGPLSAPNYSIDLAALLKDNLRAETKEKVKQKLKDKLDEKLHGLF